jgi:hypothetical protein
MLDDNWTTKQWRKIITKKYPYLLPRRMSDGEVSPDYDYEFLVGEYDLPKGWFELFLQCCEDLYEPLKRAEYLEHFRFLDVKEKYGSMRFSTCRINDEVFDILNKYEFLSQQVCCICGKPATAITYGYICPYCTEHLKNSTAVIEDCEIIYPATSFKQRTWSKEAGDIIREIDCTAEWNRYLERIGYSDEA